LESDNFKSSSPGTLLRKWILEPNHSYKIVGEKEELQTASGHSRDTPILHLLKPKRLGDAEHVSGGVVGGNVLNIVPVIPIHGQLAQDLGPRPLLGYRVGCLI
jgi:hypothetical protein